MKTLMRLFRPEPNPATALWSAVVDRARLPDWYRDFGVPDTIDGRFAMVATVSALAILRLERGGDEARRRSVALTECFVADMDSEMRQLGVGDPVIAKKVGKLVGSLGARVGRWREAVAGTGNWSEATRTSIYRDEPVAGDVMALAEQRLRHFWAALDHAEDATLLGGRLP